ncbi:MULTISPECIES: FAD:protein FMN transferase [unclassified Lentimonas]|uniref:FAD:protein FMN transferase n=1 Tax=unclassified Lentimonas TaxID=2630993 RepID=UPI00132A9F6F|nr:MULTISPECIES: FAD:protein FMN transferase [unclassified Lentimonas]CAA6678863.1 Nitrous oxide reductase maturation periplasmic protein NosX [Lentimonas sp. CC4]CAA6684467.1 Nitrous oxide reductase maturation periplasmic protein NosX [Lentimonas sp. CC6]CAA7077453.1 Nitrous oxide reductase maturation periplasmic protein NosX [Lentimonas sp. CC4]CAA7171288.1 Nitrous oxide reductase maturation periplasmic protein NosX [Lentimonas sp. CC21]CAA7183318.1 Nitrous oxide reductase maturation peripla
MQRRRFIKILATSAAGMSLGNIASALPTLQAVRWSGYTLGAEGSFTLYAKDRSSAQNVLKHCFAEIRRLESLFSLYDPTSELCRLNRDGQLNTPSPEWQPLLAAIDQAYALSNGLFDPTVQPLWQTYATHFKHSPETTAAPHPHEIAAALKRTGWQHIEHDTKTIRFNHPGMQLTLNGIAQGYITDHISDILKNAGYQHVLIELGETRAIGSHPEQRPWSIGIKDAHYPSELHDVAELDNQALATSGSYGSPFSKDGHYHHLIHPQTGLPATRWKSLSVIAPTATQADALSTGLSFASAKEIETIQSKHSELRVLKQS